MSVTVKAFLQDGNLSEPETRRFQISNDEAGSYDQLITKICEHFPNLQPGTFSVSRKGNGDKQQAFTTDQELREALGTVGDGVFKINLHVNNKGGKVKRVLTEQDVINNTDGQSERFVPPPQFRRWMRRFVKRWHIRQAPNVKVAGPGEKAETEDPDSGNDDTDGVVEDFITSVEDVMTTLVDPSDDCLDDTDNAESNDNDAEDTALVADSNPTEDNTSKEADASKGEENKECGKDKRGQKAAGRKQKAGNVDSNNKGRDEMRFVPTSQFRRWMRGFMKRWHIRHAPNEKPDGTNEKVETGERDSGNGENKSAVAEFIKSIEDAMATFIDQSGDEDDQVNESETPDKSSGKEENKSDEQEVDKANKRKRQRNKRRFRPSRPFRRWLRRFVRRWHIRHAPGMKGVEQCANPEKVENSSGKNEPEEIDNAVEDFLTAVEDAVTSFGDPSDIDGECDESGNANDKEPSDNSDTQNETKQKSVDVTSSTGPSPLTSIENSQTSTGQGKGRNCKRGKQRDKLNLNSDESNPSNDSEQEQGVPFTPSPQFRRWMRRFMKRWHIRQAPKEKEAELNEKAESVEPTSGNDEQEVQEAVAEFIKSVEDAVAAYVGSSGDGDNVSNGNELNAGTSEGQGQKKAGRGRGGKGPQRHPSGSSGAGVKVGNDDKDQ